MDIPKFTLVGFLTVYVVQGIVFVLFIIIAYKILKRSKKQINVMLSSFFISAAIGLAINFIYVVLIDEQIVLILYYLTLFFIFLAPIFFLIFNLMVLKSENKFSKGNQFITISIYAIIIFCMIFIPDGVKINENTDWQPVWSVFLILYLIIMISAFAVLPGIYYSVKVYKKFNYTNLKKKWTYYLIGVCLLYFLMYAIMFSNFLNDWLIRSIIGFFGVIFSIIGGLLIYYGVGKMEE